jgi:hypothetical protein
MKAHDIEVVELAVSVIFYACLQPKVLNFNPPEADWKEGAEVSKMCIYVYIYIYMYVCIYIYTYIHIYIHIYRHVYR